jgi:hypothetical protein
MGRKEVRAWPDSIGHHAESKSIALPSFLPFPPPAPIRSSSFPLEAPMHKDDIVNLTGEKDARPSDKFSRR